MSEIKRQELLPGVATPAATEGGDADQGQTPSRPAGAPAAPAAPSASTASARGAPINILIVDDEPRNLTVLETVLADPRYRLIRAESADQALLALVAEEFALLILDIQMPGMTGIELAQMIKGRKKTAQVPIIFLTAYYNEDQHVLEGYGTGAVDYLHKPVNPAILRSKVAVFAELHTKSRELALSNAALLAEVTERRRAEDQLRELNETLEDRVTRSVEALTLTEMRYRRLFEAAKDGILILDSGTGHVSDANPIVSQILGCTPGHLLGKELWELGLFSSRSANAAALQELRAQGYLRFEPAPIARPDGRRIEAEVVASVYLVGQDSVVQCNIRDITERRRLEGLLREQAKALEELDRRKDEFLAMLSHELRNPLAPIAHASQLLGSQENEDQLQRQARTTIDRQVRHLTKLVDDLLDVSRITTGKLQLRREPVAVSAVVESAVETVRPLLEQRRQVLQVSLAPSPTWLHADAVRLEQVLVNLLTNAVKYTDEGGRIGLTIQTEGDECVLRVWDTGVGITPEFLPHVFGMFTQVDQTLARSQGGLGIGLALVKRLVELHGGRVEAHSTLGQGCEFVVHLPMMAAPAPRASVPPAPARAQGARSLRVLIVDDNEDAALMLGMRLKAAGHTIKTVHNGLDALDEAPVFGPDVILLDIGLPGMDGYEVARTLRRQELFKDVVLIATTGYGQESDRRLAEQAGFDHHLVKPTDFTKLKQILERSGRAQAT